MTSLALSEFGCAVAIVVFGLLALVDKIRARRWPKSVRKTLRGMR